MSLRVYNTLSRAIEPFVPLVPGKVGMYVCGMTIYDLCHMGHLRMMMSFDVVYRWLKASGFDVTYVRNITDIDDKIIKRALERGIPIGQLTAEMTDAMYEDFAKVKVERPTHEPRATQYVPQMLDLIQQLEARGLAYRASNGDVNYAVRKFPGYGKLSGKSLDDLRAGERVSVDTSKQDPLDFVLWKAAKADEPADAKWPGPYGPGRPGWHIECSAMSCSVLGQAFDIHGGGQDLQFPHHENEIAQSQGAGHRFAHYWLHNGFLNVDGEKMSKSLGNFFTIRDVLQKFDGETLRFFMLRTHYRRPFNFSDSHLEDARTALRRLYTALESVPPAHSTIPSAVNWDLPPAAAFKAAMDNDFGTPDAVAVLFELATDINRSKSTALATLMKALGGILGVLQDDPTAYLRGQSGREALAGDEQANIEALIAQRQSAKEAKNWADADRIRKQLLEQGVVLKDSPAGTTWSRA